MSRLRKTYNLLIGKPAGFRIRTLEDKRSALDSLKMRMITARRACNDDLAAKLSQAKEYFKQQSNRICACGMAKARPAAKCSACVMRERTGLLDIGTDSKSDWPRSKDRALFATLNYWSESVRKYFRKRASLATILARFTTLEEAAAHIGCDPNNLAAHINWLNLHDAFKPLPELQAA